MEALIEEMLGGRILLSEAVEEFEKIYIQKALEQNDDHLTRTAEALGIHRNTLANRLTLYNGAKQSRAVASKSRTSARSKKKPQTKKLKARAAGSSR